jgi:hypothetical protein
VTRLVAVIAAVLALLVAAAPSSAAPRRAHAVTVDQISAIGSQLAGEPVTVSCESTASLADVGLPGYDGFVLFPDGVPQPVIHLRLALCAALERIDLPKDRNPSVYDLVDGHRALVTTGEAVLVLTHEAMHIRLRSSDEAVVNCTAYRNRWTAINLFGPATWVASAIAYGATQTYRSQPDDYRLDGC